MNLPALVTFAGALALAVIGGAVCRASGGTPGLIAELIVFSVWWMAAVWWHAGAPRGWTNRLALLDAPPRMLFLPLWPWVSVIVGVSVVEHLAPLALASKLTIGGGIAVGMTGLGAVGVHVLRVTFYQDRRVSNTR